MLNFQTDSPAFKVPLSAIDSWEPNNRPSPDGQLVVVGERKLVATYQRSGEAMTIGLFRAAKPLVGSEFNFPTGDATGYVIQGVASVQLLDEGRVIRLQAGDLFHFKKGTRTQWTYLEPFIKFETVSG